jgi:hypothetical protein
LPGIWNCSIPAYEDDRSVGGDGDIHDVVRTVAAPGAFGVVAEIEERPTGVGDFLVAPSNADIVVLPTAASEVQHNEVLAGVSGKSGDTIRIIQMRYCDVARGEPTEITATDVEHPPPAAAKARRTTVCAAGAPATSPASLRRQVLDRAEGTLSRKRTPPIQVRL